jgi:SAM-dependent methyltransferase
MAHWTEITFEDKSDAFVHILEDKLGEATAEIDSILELVDDVFDVRPDRVLDVGCGIGRHAVPFARHGCHVEGIDISDDYLDRARDRAEDTDLDGRVEFHNYDMRDLDEWEGSYDLVTVFFDTLGYYGKETDRDILASLQDLLSETGVLLVELTNKDTSIGTMWDAQAKRFGDIYRLQRLEYDVRTGYLTSQMDMFSDEQSTYEFIDTVELNLRLYSPAEFRELCTDVGFEDVSLYGDFSGSEMTMRDSTFVAVAR